MPTITAKDGTNIAFIDWGEGQPVVFSHGWGLGAACWESQLLAFASAGRRAIAHDRRGAGRSDDPATGYDYNTWADDLATLLNELDLEGVTLVGHSMGCGEIIRYLSRHGSARVSNVALLAPNTPFLLQTPDNPTGLPPEFFAGVAAAVTADRPSFMSAAAETFFGVGYPGSVATAAPVDWGIRLALSASARATIAMIDSWREDLRPDLQAVDVPTVVIHGDRDTEPTTIERCGRPTAHGIKGASLVVYEGGPHGLFASHRTRLNQELLAFANS